MKKFFLVFILIISDAWAETIFSDSAKKNAFELEIVDSVKISKSKLCSEKKCQAYKVAMLKNFDLKKIVWDRKRGSNPTSKMCHLLSGTPRIYYLNDLSEISVCEFMDGSFLLAWDLLDKFNKLRR